MKYKLPFFMILIVSIGGSVVMGQKLFTALREYKEGENIYEEISEIAHIPTPTASIEITTPEIPEIAPTTGAEEKI